MRATKAAGAILSLVLGCAAVLGAIAMQADATRPALPATAPTFAGNRALARAAVAHLLTLAEPPPGAVPAGAAPARLSGITVNPEVPDYVDVHAFWTVHLSVAAVLDFMGGHPPDGFTETGNSSGGGPDAVQTLTFTEPAARAWGTVQSEVAVSRLSATTSGIRVDDVAEWLDPRPESDAGPGRRLRVTVGTPCPASDNQIVGVESPGPFVTTRMVPAIAPTAARVCSYSGLDSRHPLALVRDRLLGAAEARMIARSAAGVSLAHQNGAAFNCALDDGSEIAIALRYPGRPDVDLWYSPTGCRSLSNGRIYAIDSGFVLPDSAD